MDRKLVKAIEAMTVKERMLVLEKLTFIIDEIDKYRNAYFWSPSRIAIHRRLNEFEHSETVVIGEYEITFTSRYRESCHNCYYSKDLCFNGKKTNTKKLINIIAKIKELEKVEE